MLLLHALAAAMIAAALLLLASRVALWHVGRKAYVTPESRRVGARSGLVSMPYLWIGPLVVSRGHWPGGEVAVDRFHGLEGRARTITVAFAGVQCHADMHDRTARLWLVAPHFAAVSWLGWQLGDVVSLSQAMPLLLLIVIDLCIVHLIVRCDVLATDLHYAHRGAELGEHEAYARGCHEGIRYETDRQRHATGQRYDAPTYPANPYAA